MYLKKDHFKKVLQYQNIDPEQFDKFERLSSKAGFFSTGSRVLIIYVDTVVFNMSINKNVKKITLNSNGWYSVTTKKWINYGLDLVNSGKYIKQSNFQWYLMDRSNNKPDQVYYDNMTIKI